MSGICKTTSIAPNGYRLCDETARKVQVCCFHPIWKCNNSESESKSVKIFIKDKVKETNPSYYKLEESEAIVKELDKGSCENVNKTKSEL